MHGCHRCVTAVDEQFVVSRGSGFCIDLYASGFLWPVAAFLGVTLQEVAPLEVTNPAFQSCSVYPLSLFAIRLAKTYSSAYWRDLARAEWQIPRSCD